MTLKWSKKSMDSSLATRSLGINEFAKSFGASKEEVSVFCSEHIKKLDFTYAICPQETREEIFLDSLKRCDDNEFKISGAHRKPDWNSGWKEILIEFKQSGQNLKSLIPKDIKANRPLRYDGNYIIPHSRSFEHDFTFIFRNWLFKKYFKDYENIYEFGCGTGHNLALLASIFPSKTFFGLDWAEESVEILHAVSKKYQWNMKGFQFDFFNPDYSFKIPENSIVYTSAALEQLGKDHEKFTDYILSKKPALCVNVEPIAEYYNEHSLFDYVALKYHTCRNYLDGFLTHLQNLQKEKKIEIIAAKRLGFGSLYHEANSYIIWKPL